MLTQEEYKGVATGDFVYRHDNVPIITRSYGSVLEDSAGRRYLDAEAANGTAGLGFDSSILENALSSLRCLPTVPSFCETDIRLRVAAKLANNLNTATGLIGKVSFELGGAQGMELALKIVRANTTRTQFVVFEGGYHGRSGMASQFSASHRYRRAVGEWRLPIARLPYPDCEQCRFSKRRATCSHECISYSKKLLSSEIAGVGASQGSDIAAFILEPVLNAGGIVWPDHHYLEEMVNELRSQGALIVVDEIFCGFYRTGQQWGFQNYKNFTPDIIVVSKALTNGLVPFSCVWAREDLVSSDRFPPGSHSATYLNYPLGLAIAEQVIDRYEQWEGLPEQLRTIEASLLQTVTEAAAKFDRLIVNGHAKGALARLLLHGPIAGKILDTARTIAENDRVSDFCGLILASTGLSPNVIAINPALTINQEELLILRELLFRTLHRVTEV